jgi:hypothetical protein
LFIFQAKKYLIDNNFLELYGISQNPDTNDYILVQNITILNLISRSGNKKIDNFIQEKKSKIKWMPYNQFNEINKIGTNNLMTVYSAIWKNRLLYKRYWWNTNYTRDLNKVTLKCLHNSKNFTESVINEV